MSNYSLEVVYKIYDDTTGYYTQVGDDSDSLGLLEISVSGNNFVGENSICVEKQDVYSLLAYIADILQSNIEEKFYVNCGDGEQTTIQLTENNIIMLKYSCDTSSNKKFEKGIYFNFEQAALIVKAANLWLAFRG